ncbi:DUF2795 domain-containing protein [Kineosporiaceae bacterium B12]|nr:DUF2795 domain-containing protein [Kineococcus rubinsiae]
MTRHRAGTPPPTVPRGAATRGVPVAEKVSPIDIQKHLSGVEYPASKQALVDHAKESGAPQEVLDALQELGDGDYDAPTAVTHGVFGS